MENNKHKKTDSTMELNEKKTAAKAHPLRDLLEQHGWALRVPALVAAAVYFHSQAPAAAVYLYLEGLATLLLAIVASWLRPSLLANYVPPVRIRISGALVLSVFMMVGADLLVLANLVLAVVLLDGHSKHQRNMAEARVVALSKQVAGLSAVAGITRAFSGLSQVLKEERKA